MAFVTLFVTILQLSHLVQAANITYAAPGGKTGTVDEALLWGPYKPNLYFGVRPRLPQSLTTGLLWSSVNDYQAAQQSMYISVPNTWLLLLT